MKVIRSELTTEQLVNHLREARARLLELVGDLSDEQMIGPRLAIVNPLRWEIAHVAHFQEFWLLRHQRGYNPINPAADLDSDKLYDSAKVHHDTRWDLPLPSKLATIDYTQRILDLVTEEVLKKPAKPDANGYDDNYFLHLSLLHEDMHNEAITYTRQTLGYRVCSSAFRRLKPQPPEGGTTNALGDAFIPGASFRLGSELDSGFVFDNELLAHEVAVAPFAISRTAVSNAEFLAFVEAGGYRCKEFWSDEGWRWRESVAAEHPVYWRKLDGEWQRRVFDQWVRLEENLPVIHINWFEADAYCRWAGRRLPTEAEWELAAGGTGKRKFPWGDEAPTAKRANLDWQAGALLPVDALPDGDSEFGVRQMIGNVWEWTATDFAPFDGFTPGPYKEYSAPWFGDHKVLRGGCWATRSRLVRNGYRNFYKPDRRDVWAGFRTCAK
ncbi:MAG: selenoneine synthase SenA [Acidobacteriota bacterium]|nr:selenoneine synthase SenA [Acidobacteriota bacterium]